MNPRILAAAVPALLASACTVAPVIPDPLVPTGSQLAMVVPARGVQVYECRAKAGDKAQWAFVAPDAELFDIRGHRIGVHGAGPFWQAADGSRIVAKVKAKADSPAGAIPWLLLESSSTGPEGAFSRVTHIQRVNTTGGNAPARDCHAGEQARVQYTADYRFFTSAR